MTRHHVLFSYIFFVVPHSERLSPDCCGGASLPLINLRGPWKGRDRAEAVFASRGGVAPFRPVGLPRTSRTAWASAPKLQPDSVG